MIHVLPDAALYSLIDFVPEEQRAFLQGKPVNTSFIQRMPFAERHYRYYLPLAPFAIEQLNVHDHDIVLSSSYAVAKGALTRSDQLHLSYVHSPIRYAWDLQFEYLEQRGLSGLRGLLARMVLHYMRLFDATSAHRVDAFAANSRHVARRIWKTYRRTARVIYPPVDTGRFTLYEDKEPFYLAMSRLVEYKRMDLIVEAFNEMPDKELIVIGDGPEMDRLEDLAGPNVSLLGRQPDDAVEYYMQRARAFVFAAEEDFGIVPVEAQACGTPVIAYGKGGALETVVPGTTGLFFQRQSAAAICHAVRRFAGAPEQFEPGQIREHAEQFAVARFRRELAEWVESTYHTFQADGLVKDDAVEAIPPRVTAPDVTSQDAPSQDAPSQDAPSQDAPSQDTPSQDAPSSDTPSSSEMSSDAGSPGARRTNDVVGPAACSPSSE
jgi:glycosyltransferase involved in cell wall biosynthesis